MGTLYKRAGSRNWMMAVTVAGRQHCKSAHTSNKRLADQLLSRWETEVFEGRYYLPSSKPPTFEDYAKEFLKGVQHPNTRRRYASSVENLKKHFATLRVSDITADGIEEYQQARLGDGVEPATINHDLRVLRRMMRIAERKRLIGRSPLVDVEPLKERSRRAPHIVTFEEEEKILSAAVPYMRMLVVLILETGMRSHTEALALLWDAIDFANDTIRVRKSKTHAGIRNIPLSARCKAELLRWRKMFGPDFSSFVFPNMRSPTQPLKDVRQTWENTLRDAGLPRFVLYNLRHTHASRLMSEGVSSLFIAQMLGHSSPSIVGTYAKATDEYKRDAIRRLERMRSAHVAHQSTTPTSIN
jgi:integrase